MSTYPFKLVPDHGELGGDGQVGGRRAVAGQGAERGEALKRGVGLQARGLTDGDFGGERRVAHVGERDRTELEVGKSVRFEFRSP